MEAAGKQRTRLSQYLPVYAVLLVIAGLEVVVAYQDLPVRARLASLLVLAFFGAGMAVMYFMHLARERRSLLVSLLSYTIFVLLLMNMIWSDSFRLLRMRLFSH